MTEAAEKVLSLLKATAICGCKPSFGKPEQKANVECQSETKTLSCETHQLSDTLPVFERL